MLGGTLLCRVTRLDYRAGVFGAQAVLELHQALGSHGEDAVAPLGVVFGQAFQVIVDAGNHVCQGIQFGPGGYLSRREQLLDNITPAIADDRCALRQWQHVQTAAHAVEQIGDGLQQSMIPLPDDEGVDRFAAFFQRIARFLYHLAMHQHHILGCGQALHVAALPVTGRLTALALHAENAVQAGLHVQQAPRHIHQRGIVDHRLTGGELAYQLGLFLQYPPWLAQTQHGQGVGNLLHGGNERRQILGAGTIAAHEQIQLILDQQQFLAERFNHRLHGTAVRTDQARAGGLIGDVVIGKQCLELIALLERVKTRTAARALGHIEQQVAQQFRCRRGVQCRAALIEQMTDFPVSLTQQLLDGSPCVDDTVLHTLYHAGVGGPQVRVGRSLTQRLQAGEHLAELTRVGLDILIANDARMGNLHCLTQLAQLPDGVLVAQVAGALGALRGTAGINVRGKQGVLGQQVFTAGGAHVVEQRQEHQRQITTAGLDAVQIGGQLQYGLHQHVEAFALTAGGSVHQRLGKLLHFLGEQSRAVEFDHLKCAVNLVNIGQAETQPG